MPTLEELEQRVTELERLLPTLSTGRSPEFRELEARVYEQIDALRQQLAEQQRQMLIDRNATNVLLNKTDQLQSDVRTLQTTINHMQQDLHLIIEMFRTQQAQLDHQQTQLAEVKQEMNGRFEQVDQRFSALEQSVNSRFDQVIALLSRHGQ